MTRKEVTEKDIETIVELGFLLMDFAGVNRATYLNKDRRLESDTDHTVMLSVIACAVAARFCPELDLGKIAQYSIVHDLVEVHAGDTSTANFHTTDFKTKEAAEHEAFLRIKKQFGKTLPWVPDTIRLYESLADPEARFVKTIDKVMPAITHIHNNGLLIDEVFDTHEEFESSVYARHAHMKKTYANDQEVALQIRKIILDRVIQNQRLKKK